MKQLYHLDITLTKENIQQLPVSSILLVALVGVTDALNEVCCIYFWWITIALKKTVSVIFYRVLMGFSILANKRHVGYESASCCHVCMARGCIQHTVLGFIHHCCRMCNGLTFKIAISIRPDIIA